MDYNDLKTFLEGYALGKKENEKNVDNLIELLSENTGPASSLNYHPSNRNTGSVGDKQSDTIHDNDKDAVENTPLKKYASLKENFEVASKLIEKVEEMNYTFDKSELSLFSKQFMEAISDKKDIMPIFHSIDARGQLKAILDIIALGEFEVLQEIIDKILMTTSELVLDYDEINEVMAQAIIYHAPINLIKQLYNLYSYEQIIDYGAKQVTLESIAGALKTLNISSNDISATEEEINYFTELFDFIVTKLIDFSELSDEIIYDLVRDGKYSKIIQKYVIEKNPISEGRYYKLLYSLIKHDYELFFELKDFIKDLIELKCVNRLILNELLQTCLIDKKYEVVKLLVKIDTPLTKELIEKIKNNPQYLSFVC